MSIKLKFGAAPSQSGLLSLTRSESRRRGRWVLALALMVQTTVSVVTHAYSTLGPFLQADLGLTRAEIGLLQSYIFGGIALASTAAGWAADVLGDRVVLALGGAAVGALAVTVGLLPGMTGAMLMAVLILIGVAGATSTPAGSHAVYNAFTPERRGLAMGLRQTGIPLGGMVAAALLPPVALVAGWRGASVVAGALALAGAAAALWIRPAAWAPRDARPRPPGRRPSAAGKLLTRDVALAAFSGVTLPVAQYCMVAYLLLYLKERFGLPVTTGAPILALGQLAGGAGRVVWSGASDWLFAGRRRPMLLLVLGMAGLSALVLSALPADVPTWVLAAVVIWFGSCAVGWQGLHVTLMTELANPGWEARTVGFALVFTSTGIVVGPPLFGLLVDHTGNYRLAWALLPAVLAVGIFLLGLVRERRTAGQG